MCRNIKPLFNFAPPATADEVRASALQFVRKVSGFTETVEGQRQAFNGGRRRHRGRRTTDAVAGDDGAAEEPRGVCGESARKGAERDGRSEPRPVRG